MAGADARPSTTCRRRRWVLWRNRRWRHISIVLLTAAACSLSLAQFFLAVLVFTYIDIPQCVLVGQNLALVASVLSLGDAVFYFALGRRFRHQGGARDQKSFCQKIFYFVLTLRTTVWWLTCLNGAFIYGFNRNHIGCPPEPISAILGRIMSACQMYQVSLSLSVPAFIASALELALFFRCQRPFLTYRAIFHGDEAVQTVETAQYPVPTYVDKETPASSPASSFSVSTSEALPYPVPRTAHIRTWSCPLRSVPPLCELDSRARFASETTAAPYNGGDLNIAKPQPQPDCNKPLPRPVQPVDFTTPSWSPQASRTASCATTLVDPLSRRSSAVTAIMDDDDDVPPLPRAYRRESVPPLRMKHARDSASPWTRRRSVSSSIRGCERSSLPSQHEEDWMDFKLVPIMSPPPRAIMARRSLPMAEEWTRASQAEMEMQRRISWRDIEWQGGGGEGT